MSKTNREIMIMLSALGFLANEIGGLLMQEAELRRWVALDVSRVTQLELDAALRDLEGRRRIAILNTETGRKVKITDEGRAFLAETQA